MADADLVLEGGGVKGFGLLGAVAALAGNSDPYTFHRVAGTSSGAVIAAFLAAGMSALEIKAVLDALDLTLFQDETGCLRHIPVIGQATGLLLHEGMFAGNFLHDWVSATLAAHGVRTWSDLKIDDPGGALPPEQRYRLVVIVSDVSRGLMLRLPWDYERLLGINPDSVPVAEAIRASASIPFFFRPWKMKTNAQVTGHSHIVCVDGGLLSNFPLTIFDRDDGRPSRWPTIGVKLSAETSIRSEDWKPDNNSFQLAKSLLSTLVEAHDNAFINDPQAVARTIFVNTAPYKSTDFNLSEADKEILFNRGLASGNKFLGNWDWQKWKAGDYSS